jgi:hypothetical protein
MLNDIYNGDSEGACGFARRLTRNPLSERFNAPSLPNLNADYALHNYKIYYTIFFSVCQ